MKYDIKKEKRTKDQKENWVSTGGGGVRVGHLVDRVRCIWSLAQLTINKNIRRKKERDTSARSLPLKSLVHDDPKRLPLL
jgi:hypothetical protein